MTVVSQTPTFPEFDDDGLIVDPSKWNEEIAEEVASAEHWVAIYALRNYYDRFGVAPAMISICRDNNKPKHWIHNLFESCLNAWRVSGLSNPGEEAKSYLSDM